LPFLAGELIVSDCVVLPVKVFGFMVVYTKIEICGNVVGLLTGTLILHCQIYLNLATQVYFLLIR
jgi:hypothetical protein